MWKWRTRWNGRYGTRGNIGGMDLYFTLPVIATNGNQY